MTITEVPASGKAGVRRNREGTPWEEVYERIERERPSTRDGEWNKTIPLTGLMQFIGDIDTVGVEWGVGTGSRGGGSASGRRQLEHSPETIHRGICNLFYAGCGVGMGPRIEEDYTSEPFVDALRYMMGQRTIAQMSRRTGINRQRMTRLVNGTHPPTGVEMEMLARTFLKKPWYFREYRNVLVAIWVISRLERSPEHAVALAREIDQDVAS